MIMGAAVSTVYYNLRFRHPTLDLPVIDYDLALLFQPMLMLGISIGVAFNVMFADWMVTVLLIILFIGNHYLLSISSSAQPFKLIKFSWGSLIIYVGAFFLLKVLSFVSVFLKEDTFSSFKIWYFHCSYLNEIF